MKTLFASLLVASSILAASPAFAADEIPEAALSPVEVSLIDGKYYFRQALNGVERTETAIVWNPGPWLVSTACSGSGTHTETRTVTCQRNGQTVADSECTGEKPPHQQVTSCSYQQRCQNLLSQSAVRPVGVNRRTIYSGAGGVDGPGVKQWVQIMWDRCNQQPRIASDSPNWQWCSGEATLENGAYTVHVYMYEAPAGQNPPTTSDPNARTYYCS